MRWDTKTVKERNPDWTGSSEARVGIIYLGDILDGIEIGQIDLIILSDYLFEEAHYRAGFIWSGFGGFQEHLACNPDFVDDEELRNVDAHWKNGDEEIGIGKTVGSHIVGVWFIVNNPAKFDLSRMAEQGARFVMQGEHDFIKEIHDDDDVTFLGVESPKTYVKEFERLRDYHNAAAIEIFKYKQENPEKVSEELAFWGIDKNAVPFDSKKTLASRLRPKL